MLLDSVSGGKRRRRRRILLCVNMIIQKIKIVMFKMGEKGLRCATF